LLKLIHFLSHVNTLLSLMRQFSDTNKSVFLQRLSEINWDNVINYELELLDIDGPYHMFANLIFNKYVFH